MVTWKIWLHPNIRTVRDGGPRGQSPVHFGYADFAAAVQLADTWVQRHCGWRLQVTTGGDYTYRIYSQNPTTYRPMWLGGDGHAAGMNQQQPRVIFIHDGYVPEWSHSSPYSFYHAFVRTVDSLAQLVLHELGHDRILLDRSHAYDVGSLRNPTIPEYLQNLVRGKFGQPAAPPPPPVAPALVPLGTEVTTWGTCGWTFRLSQKADVKFSVNGTQVIHHPTMAPTQHTVWVSLGKGKNLLTAVATNTAGQTGTMKDEVEYKDPTPPPPPPPPAPVGPTVTHGAFYYPRAGVAAWAYTLGGSAPARVRFYKGTEVMVEVPAAVYPREHIQHLYPVQPGDNLYIRAENEHGKAALEIVAPPAPPAPAWQNQVNQFDVNDDGEVTPQDALHIINALNKNPNLRVDPSRDPGMFYDVDGNGVINAADALAVIGALNRATDIAAALGSPEAVVLQEYSILPQPVIDGVVVGDPTTEELVAQHNAQRRVPLVPNARLQEAAQRHARWMADRGRMSHTGEGRSTPARRVSAAGYPYSLVAENVAAGQRTVSEVMRAWLGSRGHRANIKNTNLREIGVGYASSPQGGIYWCVVFGSPPR